ncbi:MAG: bifunctional phosphoribosyl-AMP cyclohydrolase/phosphoribosyl-ATP diphosphatase HisIE [Nitrospirota bacterium]|nr:bifunctional phosphoribosyl-AMP cyclohydrolase/phosphoribosyl-ATP diphosphatase HisIE [Nitrospirota bacterium]
MNTLDQSVKWNADGLVPAIVQDAADGRVLMLAWMNAESLKLTLSTGYTHFWSRSRRQLWKKGETSGNLQQVRELRLDCDGDTLVAIVDQSGPACHTDSPTCFFQLADAHGTLTESPQPQGLGPVLEQVYQVILARKVAADPESSYVAKLFAKGTDAILKKIAEESGEVLLAAKGGQPEELTYEAADLIFHLLVALANGGVTPHDVSAELARRFGMSGIDEKASRKGK